MIKKTKTIRPKLTQLKLALTLKKRNAYENIKFINPKVVKVLIIPSSEVTSITPSSNIYTLSLICVIKLTNEISSPKINLPISQIEPDINEIILIICLHIHNDSFIKIIKIMALNINAIGGWTFAYVIWENRYVTT